LRTGKRGQTVPFLTRTTTENRLCALSTHEPRLCLIESGLVTEWSVPFFRFVCFAWLTSGMSRRNRYRANALCRKSESFVTDRDQLEIVAKPSPFLPEPLHTAQDGLR